jgi:hypothetical protein
MFNSLPIISTKIVLRYFKLCLLVPSWKERLDIKIFSVNVSAWAWFFCWCMAPSCCGAHSSARGHYCCVAVLCCYSCSAAELWPGTGIGRPDRLSSGESSFLKPGAGIGQRILQLKLLLYLIWTKPYSCEISDFRSGVIETLGLLG